jgi:nicotinamide mononucleotide transporter
VTHIEIIASLLVLINIILVVVRSVWNYPFALAGVTVSAVVLYDAKLYSDTGLQLFFFVVNLYGWWAWHRNKAETGDIQVRRLSVTERAGWIGGSILTTGLWGWFMHANTDASYPWWDASVAMLSVVGQILMARRYIENWHWWIVVNILSVGLYFSKGLFVFAGLYVVILGMALWGLSQWRKAEARA